LRAGNKSRIAKKMLDAVTFAATSLVLLAAPGPTNALLASAGALAGRRALPLVVAVAAGYILAVGSLVLLAGPVLANKPMMIVALKFTAAAWLFWTALSLWRGGAKRFDINGPVRARTVFITTLLNPKSLVIAFGLMPPVVAGPATMIGHLAAIVALAIASGGVWIAGGAGLARVGAAPYVAKATAVTLGTFGAFLIGSAIS
jgi:threonine/homoserine/homoserine lactone efflux protein